jgi:hypothetical protein
METEDDRVFDEILRKLEDRNRAYGRLRRRARNGVSVAVVALVAAGWIGFRVGDNSDRVRVAEATVRETRAELGATMDSLTTVRRTIADREERFEVMSHACARLINQQAEEAEAMRAAVVAFYNGRAAEGRDIAESYARSQTVIPALPSSRGLCGMRLRYPNRGTDEVIPIGADWVNGVEPPPF